MQEAIEKEKIKENTLSKISRRIGKSNIRWGENEQLKDRRAKRKGKSDSIINIIRNNNLSTLNNIQIDLLKCQGVFEQCQDLDKFVTDIYPQVKKDLSIFLHTKAFNDKSTSFEFMTWMLDKLKSLYDGVNWGITYTGDAFMFCRLYDYDEIGCEGRSVGIKFMTGLRASNLYAYDMFINLFSLMNSKLGTPFWFFNEDMDNIIDILEAEITDGYGGDEEESAYKQEVLECYKQGEAKIVENEIRNCKMTLDDLTKAVVKFNPKNKKEEVAKECIVLGIALFSHGDTVFNDFIHITKDEYSEGLPGDPYDYAGIGWSYDHDSDPIAWWIGEGYQSKCNEYGCIPFRDIVYGDNEFTPSLFLTDYTLFLDELLKMEMYEI